MLINYVLHIKQLSVCIEGISNIQKTESLMSKSIKKDNKINVYYNMIWNIHIVIKENKKCQGD